MFPPTSPEWGIHMGRFASDPDYTMRWPMLILRSELDRLIVRGRVHGETQEWRQEVELLLRQAFSGSVPAEDFAKVAAGHWDYDDEPF